MRPWTVDKKYVRSVNPHTNWVEPHCPEAAASINEQTNWLFTMRPYRIANFDPFVLKPDIERVLKPKDHFRECAKDCPEMIVIPPGKFMMGSLVTEKGRYDYEDDGYGHQHKVTIAKPFAVSKYEVTFAEWDACVAVGGCPRGGMSQDQGWGRGTQPVINVNWEEARQYAAWLSRMTGKPYRLLSEAEWEYAARAFTQTRFSWGNNVGRGNASCYECGSRWDYKQPAPVGSFKPNSFGLYDMHGNVWEWVEDCYHPTYEGAPTDGSAWMTGDCSLHFVRGGSWFDAARDIRSAMRYPDDGGARSFNLGFRVARTLGP
jgi:formylglycine-generating enzyme required for sulfatase activity